MKDTMQLMQDFATRVVDALNARGVGAPREPEEFGAVMVVVGCPPEPPLGGSINFNRETGRWEFDPQIQMAHPVHGERG